MEHYDRLWQHRDVRVDDWPLMSSVMPTVLSCILYVFTMNVVGPALMRDRPPLKLRWPMLLYNLAQILSNLWLFYECVACFWLGNYSFRCQPVDFSDNPVSLRILRMTWWYYISKFADLFDTFFFVVRKKQEHVSLLHVVHHGMMPFNTWLASRFLGGGHSAFTPLLNTLVHVLLYFYYLMSAMGPKYSKFVSPCKRYLTTIQLVQFVGLMLHAFQLFFIECDYPVVFAYWIGGHAVLFFILFSQFYWRNYVFKDMFKQQ